MRPDALFSARLFHANDRHVYWNPDEAVRVPAAYHHPINLAGQADIVGVAAVAAQQHRILDAGHSLPDGKFLDRQLPRGQSFIGAFGRLIQIHDRAIPPGFR